jgi:CHAT domain-containing protein
MEKQFDQYVAFVRKQAPGVTELATPRPLPLRRFQELLHDDEAILATLATPQELYVWAITRGAVSFANVAVTEQELTDKVRQLRASLTPGSSSGTTRVPAYNAALAHELYGLIFKPVAATLKGVEHVIWFGHGPLGSLPPAVLVDVPPPRAMVHSPKDLAATSFLVDRYAFSVLADLSLFPVHRNKPLQMVHKKSFLGVGAPMLAPEELGATPRARSYELAGGMDSTALENLPKLAESVDELRALANIMSEDRATLWLGGEASEQKFVDAGLKGYQVIALATHGFLSGEIKQVPEPALMLVLDTGRKDRFDGILTSTEIARLDLDADMVILSACNTAGNDGRPRSETFTGLSQAFFTAGAGSLMSSHWPVMSGAATRLTVETVDRSRNRGKPLAVSLQQAMQAVRKEGVASVLEAHPSYWGPFVIVGDGMQSLAR